MLRRMCCGLYEVPLPKQRAESESSSDEEHGAGSQKGISMKKMQPVIVPPSPETASPDVLAQKQEQQQQQLLAKGEPGSGKWSPLKQTDEKGWGKIEEEPQQQQRAPAADAFMPVRTVTVTSPRPVTEDRGKQQLRAESPPRETYAAEGLAGTTVGAAVGGREAEREAGRGELQQQQPSRRVGFEQEGRGAEPKAAETAEQPIAAAREGGEAVSGITAAGGAATETEEELHPFDLDHFINLVRVCTYAMKYNIYDVCICIALAFTVCSA
jgi:hypothetical protein